MTDSGRAMHVSELLDLRFSLRSAEALEIDATTAPDDPIVDAFFAGYDRAFVLANEKESLDGFRACLALNVSPSYPRLRAEYGPFREVVFTATDPSVGAVIGGANFIAYPIASAGGIALCANLNYVYSDPAQRRRGYLRRLVAAVGEVIRKLFPLGPVPPPLLIFLEQNDPLRLTAEQYAHDSEHSGIDQVDRIGIWTKLGARILDFPYVQPPLSADQNADDTLLYAVIGSAAPSVAPFVLRQHLLRFFGISVLKGMPASAHPAAIPQLALLEELEAHGEAVHLLDPAPWLARLPVAGARSRLVGLEHMASLRDVLR